MASPGSPPMSNPCRELLAYAERMKAEGRYGETEDLLTRIGVGEYLAQIFGGIPMSQGEFIRLGDFGTPNETIAGQPHRRDRNPDRHRQYRSPTARAWSIWSIMPKLRPPSARRASTRRSRPSARKSANMPKRKSCRTRMNGI